MVSIPNRYDIFYMCTYIYNKTFRIFTIRTEIYVKKLKYIQVINSSFIFFCKIQTNYIIQKNVALLIKNMVNAGFSKNIFTEHNN